MKHLQHVLIALCKEDEGLTTVEYAIAGALVTVAVATAFSSLGGEVAAVLGNIVSILTAGA